MVSLSSSNWASLPLNLLDSILDYLVPMEGYFTFSEVCIEWQYAVRAKRSNHKRHCRLHQQVPLLMASIPTADNPRDRLCLYDVIKGNYLREVQLGQGRWMCEGSSHGWLILVDKVSKVTLFNPFSEKLIHLPPLEKELTFEYKGQIAGRGFPCKPRRAVLSIDPDVNGDEFVLMMTCRSVTTGGSGWKENIAFIKSGEKDWTYSEEPRNWNDIVYSNGLFYVLDERGVLFSCDVNNDFKVSRITSHDSQNGSVVFLLADACGLYMVESPEGDLLRVIKLKHEGMLMHEDVFVIHKLVWFSKNPRWEEVISLGDVSLFLGDTHSISVIASDFAGCRSNSIYFCQRRSSMDSLPGSVYVFSLNDKTVTPLYPYSEQPLLWISPKFV